VKFRMADHGGTIQFVRRGGRWRVKPRFRDSHAFLAIDWLGIAAFAIAVVMAGFALGLWRSKPDLDLESHDFAAAAGRSILARVHTVEPLAGLTKDLAATTPEDYSALLNGLARLGPGAAIRNCEGGTVIQPWLGKDLVTARYACSVATDHGRAVLVLAMKDTRKAWTITDAYVVAPRGRA
jgi:hypothetical protein